jgi:Glycosyl hydrolase family 20, domain 2
MTRMARISDVLPAVAESMFQDRRFEWPSNCTIRGPHGLAEYLRDELHEQCDLRAELVDGFDDSQATFSLLCEDLGPGAQSLSPAIRRESYKLSIRQTTITVVAETRAGLFYGIQTLLQLLSASQGSQRVFRRAPRIELCLALDYPRFEWCAAWRFACNHAHNVQSIHFLLVTSLSASSQRLRGHRNA